MVGEVQLFARRDIRSFSYLVGMLVFALFLATLPALAQLDTGSISGAVTDPTESAIRDASISARKPVLALLTARPPPVRDTTSSPLSAQAHMN